MISLSGYQIFDQIYESANSLVYRGIREQDGQAVILKVLKQGYPTPAELIRYKQEYDITCNLQVEGVIKAYELVPYQKTLAIVLEDFGGESLSQWLQKRKQAQHLSSLPLAEFLPLGVEIVQGLANIHAARVIHKDINPSNIVLNAQTGQLKIIDFGLSTMLSIETPTLQHPNVIEGTLPYISPEQTGRMNRRLDYRTDFYSLGVTFYELLTGRLPFEMQDTMELVHAHLAKQPSPPHELNPNIPLAVSDIVLKLMAKNVEDRYQSAWGLKHDLDCCLTQWQTTQTIEPFQLGERDTSDRFTIPEKLYGREREVQNLLDAFGRVTGLSKPRDDAALPIYMPRSELLLVAGVSGIGKTAVINEVNKLIVQQRGYFIKGKFDQLNRSRPFSAFIDAFCHLMEQLLSESDTDLANWKGKLLDVLGRNGQIIIDVVPELEQIIGPQPPVSELSGSAAQNRFNLLLGEFVRLFATPDHPLVIFLDDLQWADSASLNLLKWLMQELDTGYLLVLGAYRDHEVSLAHPLMITLADIEQQGIPLGTLTLKPLQAKDITQLVADTLRCSTERAMPLSQWVYPKTRGNPFFTTQFLKGIYEEGGITFDPALGQWRYDLTQVRQLALIDDDVVTFMTSRLHQLPTVTQDVLKLAACIGNQFDLETLAMVCDRTPNKVTANLWAALQEGVVIPQTETYKFFKGTQYQTKHIEASSVIYRFFHDRIQQAAYSLIPDTEKQATHLKIGQSLLQSIPETSHEEKIFEIVNQLNYGVNLLATQTQREQLAQLNLAAGRKALASTAYAAAADYLRTGLDLLCSNAWEQHYGLNLVLHESAAEAAYLQGDFVAMEQLTEQILQQAKSVSDRITAYEIKMQAYASQTRLLESLQVALQGLEGLGVHFPSSPLPSDIETALAGVMTRLQDRTIPELAALPPMQDETARSILRLLARANASAFQAAPQLFPLIFLKMVSISLEFGNAAESALGYALYGVILSIILDDWDTSYQLGELAQQLLEQFNNKQIECRTTFVTNVSLKFRKEHLKNTIQPLREAYQIGVDNGEIEFAGYSILHHFDHCFFVGHLLPELEQTVPPYINALEQFQETTSSDILRMYQQTILNLTQKTISPGDLMGDVYDECQGLCQLHEAQNNKGLFYLYCLKLYLNYIFEDFEQAKVMAEQLDSCLEGGKPNSIFPTFIFYDALTHLMMYSRGQESDREPLLKRATLNQEKLQQWANHAPMNYCHKWYLVEAERHRVLGNRLEAMESYDLAIAGAQENEYIQEEALAHELAAKFYLDWGKEHIARAYMKEAHYGYARWGAQAKVLDLEQRYPQLVNQLRQQTSTSIVSTQTSSTTGSLSTNALDLDSVLKASQALAQEIRLDALLGQMLDIMIENVGAETGYLILQWQQQWSVMASHTGAEPAICLDQPIALNSLDGSTAGLRLSQAIVNTVIHTQSPIVLNNAAHTGDFSHTWYVQQHQIKSVLCFPLIHQRQLIGILYLENNLTTNAFTIERLEVLKLLAGQAAIALENARLYSTLQASEARYQRLAANVPGVIYQFQITSSGGWQFTYLSPGCINIFEVQPEQIVADIQIIQNMIHPDEADEFVHAVLRSAETLEPWQWVGRFVLPSGQVKWIQAISHPERQADGATVWDGVLIDISDRKRSEEALQTSEAHHRALISAIPDLIMRVNRDGIYLEFVASSKFPVLGNLPNWIGAHVNTELPPELAQKRMEAIQQALQTHSTQIYEQTLLIKGKIQHEEVRVVPYDEDEVLLLVRDITDRKQAETKIEVVTQRLRLATSAAKIGVWELNIVKNQLFWDDVMYKIWNLDPDEFDGARQAWRRATHPEDRLIVNAELQAAIDDKKDFNTTFRIVWPNGQIRFIEAYGTTLRDARGVAQRMLGINWDITDRKQVEAEREKFLTQLAQLNQELEQANQQLEDYSYTLEQKVDERTAALKLAQERIIAQEKLASLGTLTAGIAHELRNPLNFVKNYAEGSIELGQELLEILQPLLATSDSEPSMEIQSLMAELQENATTIRHHSQRVEQIVDSMMQHSQTDYEHAKLEPTHLHQLLDQAIKLAYQSKRSQQTDFNLSIRTDFAADIDLMQVVPGSLIRAFINLIDNACDAMLSKQRQLESNTSSAAVSYKPTLSISTHNLGDQVEIRLRDNGCGIDSTIQSQILDPFFTTKPPGEGTGLGLSLTHDIIVKQHQGSLTIDTQPNELTEFILRLPLR